MLESFWPVHYLRRSQGMFGVFLACSLPLKESRHAWSLFGLFTTFEGVKACLSLFGLFTTFEGVKACLESFWPVHYL